MKSAQKKNQILRNVRASFIIVFNSKNHNRPRDFFIPGLDNTRPFMSFTAGAGTRFMSLLSSSPNLLGYRLMNLIFEPAPVIRLSSNK